MTDREKLKALLSEFGVGFKETPTEWCGYDFKEPNSILLAQGETKIDGYSCFYAFFEFDDSGAFQKIGIYE